MVLDSKALRVYGWDAERGEWSECRAKPGNYGKFGCTHVQHKRMTAAGADEANAEATWNAIKYASGANVMRGMTKSSYDVRNELYKYDQLAVPNDEAYRMNIVPELDTPEQAALGGDDASNTVEYSSLPVDGRFQYARGNNLPVIDVDMMDDETWEWTWKDYTDCEVSVALADGRYMTLPAGSQPLDVNVDTWNSIVASYPADVPVARINKYSSDERTVTGDFIEYVNNPVLLDPDNIVERDNGNQFPRLPVTKFAWSNCGIRMINSTGEYAVVPSRVDAEHPTSDGCMPLETGYYEEVLIRYSVNSSEERYNYRTGERSMDWYNNERSVIYDKDTGQLFRGTIVRRGDVNGEQYNATDDKVDGYTTLLAPDITPVGDNSFIRLTGEATNRLKQQAMGLGIGTMTSGEPKPIRNF